MANPRADGDDLPAQVIGRYELVSAIAPGALGELWKARIVSGPEQGRVVAIRRVPRTGTLDKSAVERLTNAGFAAMEVRHPKIAAVLDVVVADSEIALVSEHLGGALLTSLLRPASGKRPNVAPDVALRIVLDVLEAVDAARVQWRDLFPTVESEDDRFLSAAVHGGLVPDSVLLASFGEAMLLDAGLAGIAMTMHPILDHAEVIAYRAPEQLEPGGPADERADVFSAGVLVWELLAGRPLFAPAMMPRPVATGPAVKTKAFSDAMQVSTVKRKVLTALIQRLDSLPLLRGRVTKAYADVVARCLERDPAARFQSVREVIAAFSELGPKAVSGYDAVSRLLASVGAAPVEEAPVEPTSERSTSNRPTVPPEKGKGADSTPPDTRRAPAPPATDVATPAARNDALAERTKVETQPDTEPLATPVEDVDAALSAADIQSIPPTASVESVPPTASVESIAPASDVESLPPSADDRATSPATAPSSAGLSVNVESLARSAPAGNDLPLKTEPVPFTPALVPPVSGPSRTEETTSAPVVRPLDGAQDLSSTLMSSRSGPTANRKVVIGVVAAAALLAIIGIIRAAASSHPNESERASASAAPSTTPNPPEQAPPPEPAPAPASAAEALDEPVAPGTAEAPTSAPSAAPASAPAGVQAKRLQQQPAKKKPFRPSGI